MPQELALLLRLCAETDSFAPAQCPFSAKAYKTLRQQVYPKYQDKSFNITIYHMVQP